MALLRSPDLALMADSDSTSSTPTSAPSSEPLITSITSPRARKQLSLFVAGATFFAFSTLVTRRSLRRRHLASIPRFYQPSNGPPRVPINGAVEAFEALNIATINVTSVMMMMTGGMLWAFDISSMEDMRRKVRGGLGVDGSGRGESDVEEEFEEWLATVLERKKEKEEKRKRKNDDGDWRDKAREAFEEERDEARTNERGKRR